MGHTKVVLAYGLLIGMLAAGAMSCGPEKKAGIRLNVSTAPAVNRAAITALQVTVNQRAQSYPVDATTTWILGIETSAGNKAITVEGMAGTTASASWSGTIEAKAGEVVSQDIVLQPFAGARDGGTDAPADRSDRAAEVSSEAGGTRDADDGAAGRGGDAGFDGAAGAGGSTGSGGVSGPGGTPATGGSGASDAALSEDTPSSSGGAPALDGSPDRVTLSDAIDVAPAIDAPITRDGPSTGGAVDTGTVPGTGGASGTGGTTEAGGASGTGGVSGPGGASDTGGTQTSGGSSTSGGTTATGGTSSSGGSGGTPVDALAPPDAATPDAPAPSGPCYVCSSGICVPAPGAVTCGTQDSLCNLVVHDTANASEWSFQPDLQFGNQAVGTDSYGFTSAVSAEVAGLPWIRPSAMSMFTTVNPLLSFTIGSDADIYIGLDQRLSLPSWMIGWTNTGEAITYSGTGGSGSSVTQTLYKRRFTAGTVDLGPAGCLSNLCSTYTTAIKFVDNPTGTAGQGPACVQTPPACLPSITSTGGISCPGQICSVGDYSGTIVTAADTAGSHVCVAPANLCANGSSAGSWGVAVGFNLYTSAAPTSVQLSSTGLTFQLSSLPTQGVRAQVTIGYNQFYYANVTSTAQTIPWTSFANSNGTHLTQAPLATQIVFLVNPSANGTFDFCIRSLNF